MVHVGTCRRQRNWLNMIKEFNSGPAVQKVDNAIHWINLYPMVSLILIRWIVTYLVDSAIQHLNNPGQINNYPVGRATGFHNPSSQLDSKIRGTQRRFPPINTLKTLFRLSTALLDLWKCIPSSTIKHVSTWVILEKLVCLKLQGLQYYFSQNFRCNLRLK